MIKIEQKKICVELRVDISHQELVY